MRHIGLGSALAVAGSVTFVIAAAACRTPSPRAPAVPPPETRVSKVLRTWGDALQRDDEAALARAEDRAGRAALAYAGVKLLASEVPGGGKAVEATVAVNLVVWALQSMWPGIFGPPTDTFFVVLPTGSFGPALAAAGLVARVDGTPYTMTAIPAAATLGRVREASAHHQARLRAQAAWTCRPVEIVRTIQPSEPSLVRMASVSTTIFAGWLAELDSIWLVRAACTTGPGLFIVSGRSARGVVADRVLIAWLPA